ncbi:MAG: DUF2652 domain-containing protein [Anaerolineales bacterium]
MERKTQTGYLLLADISGYTSFVAQTEIEHADIALSYLLETIVEKLNATLTVAKLEGDAVFAYAEEGKLTDGKSLLELVDQTYRAFRDKALDLFSHATCSCRACRALPALDLKFMVHHGSFVIQQIAGIKDLLGTDVNLVHRLAKNHVSESTGWQGYALFTDPVLERIQQNKEGLFNRCETYEHLGDVDIYCMNMHDRYANMKSS